MNSPFGNWWLPAALAAAAFATALPAIGQVTFCAREGLVGRAYAVHGAVSNLPASELRDRSGGLPLAALGIGQPHLVGPPHRQRVSLRRGAGVVVGRFDLRTRAPG